MILLYQITPIQSPKPVGAHCVRPWMHGRVSDVKIIISLKQKCKKSIHKTAPRLKGDKITAVGFSHGIPPNNNRYLMFLRWCLCRYPDF